MSDTLVMPEATFSLKNGKTATLRNAKHEYDRHFLFFHYTVTVNGKTFKFDVRNLISNVDQGEWTDKWMEDQPGCMEQIAEAIYSQGMPAVAKVAEK